MSDPHPGQPDHPEPAASADPAGLDQAHASQHVGHDPHAAEASEHGGHEPLGPIDWVAYGVGALGILVGLATALAFAVATNRVG